MRHLLSYFTWGRFGFDSETAETGIPVLIDNQSKVINLFGKAEGKSGNELKLVA